jgi:hypothetical protein
LVVIAARHPHLQVSGKFLPPAFEGAPKNDNCTERQVGLCLLGTGAARHRRAAARRAENTGEPAAEDRRDMKNDKADVPRDRNDRRQDREDKNDARHNDDASH